MQKVTNFLEQNVQWVAIGLGALFALYMAWGYIINSPASVTVDGQAYTPGQLAKHTSETVTADLQGKMSNNTAIPVKVPHPAEQFAEAMNWRGAEQAPLPVVINSLPKDVYKPQQQPQPGAAPGTAQQPGQPTPVPMGQATLVMAPTPTPDEVRVGRSSVTIPAPPPPTQEQPTDTTGAAAGTAPPPPAPSPVTDPNAGQPQTVDKEWVTQSFKISFAELDQAFVKANIPLGQLHQTLFLNVEIVRQELDANNKPVGAEETLKPFDVTPSGQAVPPYPGDDAKLRQQQAAYEAWAVQNTQQILQPAFYTIVKGDNWLPPGQAADLQQQQYTLDNPPKNWQEIPEWREAVMKHRQNQAKERAQQKRQAAPRGAPAPSGGRGRGAAEGEGATPRFAPRDNARPAVPPRVPGGITGAAEAEPGTVPGVGPGIGEGGYAPVTPNLPQPGVAYPNGAFDPSQWKQQQPVMVWQHDTNVTPGKTYKYKMRYRIKNPLYNVGANVAKNAKDTQIFACISEFSEWSKPVTVPAKTNFFIARGITSGGNRVQFEVFKWEEGLQHSEIFDVAPGDPLGAAKNNIDFSTGWIMVGVQNNSVLLVDKDGKLMIRNQKNDETDALYKQLKDLVAIAKQQQQQTSGLTPGGVPVPPVAGGGVPIPRGP